MVEGFLSIQTSNGVCVGFLVSKHPEKKYDVGKTHRGSPKRVTFNLESVEITEKATGKLVAKGIANLFTKAYEFSHFLHVSPPTTLLSHANTSNIWHERFGHLNFVAPQ